MFTVITLTLSNIIVAACLYSMVCSVRAIRRSKRAIRHFTLAGRYYDAGNVGHGDSHYQAGVDAQTEAKRVRRFDMVGKGIGWAVDRCIK